MRWARWWFVVFVLLLAWLLVGTDCKGRPLRETQIVSFEINPNPVVRGGSVVVSWQAEHVGLQDGRPYCTLQRTFDGGPEEALEVVPCLGSRTDEIDAAVTARYVNYRFSALRSTGQAYEFEDIRLDIMHVGVTVTPASVTLDPLASQDFTATVTGLADASVTWDASCGSISGSGNTITYTAPASDGVCEVTATSVENPDVSGTANVTVTSETPRAVLFGLVLPAGGAPGSPDVVSSERTGTGSYRVQFRQDVRDCAQIGTSTAAGTMPQMVTTVAGTRANEAWRDIVLVTIADRNGSPQDGGFHLVIVCDVPPVNPRTVLFGVMLAGGGAFGSPDVVSAERTGAGSYEVQFGQDVQSCAHVATSVTSRTVPQMVTTVAGARVNPAWRDIVLVNVADANGNPQDGDFHLVIVCDAPPVGSRTVLFGRVTTGGAAHSSPDLVSAERTGAGSYEVQFGQDVWDCAQLGTSTTSRTVPQMVTTVAGVRFNSAWRDVVLVTVADANGNPQDGSFHLAVVCGAP